MCNLWLQQFLQQTKKNVGFSPTKCVRFLPTKSVRFLESTIYIKCITVNILTHYELTLIYLISCPLKNHRTIVLSIIKV